MKTQYEGKITLTEYLAPSGELVHPLPDTAPDRETLLSYYEKMVLARQFDNKAIALQRTGQLGTYASLAGSEAIDVVTALQMTQSDVLVPYYRNHIMQHLRGMDLADVLLYWGGDERGNSAEAQHQDLPNCVPIATQCLHACGVATAIKYREEARAVVTILGDGATSKGDFLEALNVAGIWQLPVVFIINNNQWAISVPRALQTIAPTLAQKALGAGIRGEQVDGNDVFAMHERVSQALERARSGKGPTVIEAVSYRLSDHTTADDATRYRSPDALKTGWEREPIKRLQTYLHQQGAWDAEQEQALQNTVADAIQQAVDRYLATPAQPVASMFEHLYAEMPRSLRQQRDIAVAREEETS